MAIEITEIHPAESPEKLNTEWFVVENRGERPFNTRNCALVVHKKSAAAKASKSRKKSKKARPAKKELGTLDPGFILSPGEKVRVHTGHSGRKAHGKLPDDDVRTYHLFLNEPVLRGAGTVLTLTLRSARVTSAVFDPEGDSGVAAPAS